MVKLARRVRMRVPAIGAAALLVSAALAACGGSSAGHPRTGTASSGTSTTATTSAPVGHPATLTLSPSHPTTHSELTFGFTAPVASGVHGSHVIAYSLSVVGAAGAGCVGAHEAGAPSVARGAHGQITLGPAEMHAPWCAGSHEARVLELRSAHCTGSAPCPQYVAVVGVVGLLKFRISAG